ncbi:MAG: alpha-amylase family glycosyl hydrolase [Polaribacter sp.]|nr:alpha-amylase family glycosyl hydrolase [Polaribacter sp.]
MKKLTSLLLFIASITYSQVTITPAIFEVTESITIHLDANSSATDCNGFSTPSKVYLHAGVGTETDAFGTSVVGNWGQDDGVGEMTFNAANSRWEITFVPKTYFGLTDTEADNITRLGFVFRNETGAQELKDNGCKDFIFAVGSFQLTLTTPANSITVLNSGETLPISASTSLIANYTLKANGTSVNQQNDIIDYTYTPTITENTNFILEATNNGETQTQTFQAVVRPTVTEASVPTGLKDGINFNTTDATKATLVIYAPGKDFIHVIGDFNNWEIDNAYLLNKDTTTDRFWIELTGLTSLQNHTYQYLIEAELRIADPYSTIVLTESNDQYINNTTYPDLPEYPTGKTNHSVTLLKTGETEYDWQTTSFTKPKKTDLVIYELLIRDFDALHSFSAVKERLDYLQGLGINAIEFMPLMEFDGNESWGYNPSFHMALDKYYGTKEAFKGLIDECHARGIAIIVDVAFNHASGQNPYYRMWNTDNGNYGGQASADSPFFNETATHSYSVFNDFNHSQQATKDYVKRVTEYWIQEYKIDGFRWDLTKGFTQNCTSNDDSCTNNFQQDRVDVLKEYADIQWNSDPDFYIIFEHLGTNNEETQWVNYRLSEGKGIMVWGNHNTNYNQATMGFSDNTDFSWISYKNRGWSVPANVSYMESHDEERLMYKNLQYGNSNGSYDIQNLPTALDRIELASAFYMTVPGPKMIWQFGELGYDYSIDYNGRVGNKPILWNYFEEQDRKDLYDTFAKLIKLKLNYEIFETSDFTLDVANINGLKRIHLTDASASEIQAVLILGNFGVTTQNIIPNFQESGNWYNVLADNEVLNVTNVAQEITLQAGEFKVYANMPATLSNENFSADEENFITLFPNPTTTTTTSFSLSEDVLAVSVFNIQGKRVKKYTPESIANNTYLIADLNQGIYFVRIENAMKQFLIRKLIIK